MGGFSSLKFTCQILPLLSDGEHGEWMSIVIDGRGHGDFIYAAAFACCWIVSGNRKARRHCRLRRTSVQLGVPGVGKNATIFVPENSVLGAIKRCAV